MPWRYLMHPTESKKSLSTKCCKSVCKTDIMEAVTGNAKKNLLKLYYSFISNRIFSLPNRAHRKKLCWRDSCHIYIYSHNLTVNKATGGDNERKYARIFVVFFCYLTCMLMHMDRCNRNVVSIWISCHRTAHHRTQHTDELGNLVPLGMAAAVKEAKKTKQYEL